MKIAYNPKTAAALTTAPANNDITFDLSGLSIYVKGVRFKGTDTTYSVFKKHGSSGGGYDGLVPVPSYNNDSKNRYLREDGTWLLVAVTDLNVLLSETTATQYRPIVLGLTYDASASNLAKSVTGLVYVTTKMYALPSTGYLYATKLFSGGKEVLTLHLSLADYVTLKTNLTITGVKTFSTLLKFTVGLGTSPFTVTSTTKVTNLNADLLDGLHSSSFSLAGHTHNYLSPVASIGSSSHAEALKNLFTNNKSNIPRNVLINYYSSSYSNGSLYFGYFLNGYDSNPYGGFYVAHYNTPYYVGIESGVFTQWALSKVGHTHAGLTFKKTDGTNVTYNGSTAIDLSGGIYYSVNATTSTKASYARNLLGRNTSGTDYNAVDGNLIFAEYNTYTDSRWYLKAKGYECRVGYANSAKNADTIDNLHASDFVRAYGTYGTSYSIDLDWGQSIVTFDPVCGGTYPMSTPNSTLLNMGNSYIRRKQLFFGYDTDNIYYRRRVGSTWRPWVRIALVSDIPSVTNYYWANVKVSASSSNTTTPRVKALYINSESSSDGIGFNGGVWLNSIGTLVILRNGNLRFGESVWDWNQWAGLKYTHSNKTIYLGIADGTVFTANSGLSGGILRFPGIAKIESNGDLYITHATNNVMTNATTNPRIVFSENGSLAVGLVYTDHDSYRATKGLKVMDVDGGDAGNVWLEALGYMYSAGFCKNGSSDSYVLLGGGGHKTISSIITSGYIGTTLVLTSSNIQRITGINGIHLVENSGILFRESNSGYYTTLRYDTYGNEALILGMKNAVTSFIVKSGDSGTTNNTTTTFNSLTPSILVKGLSLYVNSLIANGATPGYNFFVSGTSKFTNTVRISTTTGNYCEGIRLQCSDGLWLTIILGATAETGTNTYAWSIHRKSDNNFCISRNSSDGTNGMVINTSGYVGFGTSAPTDKLHVNGGYIKITANSKYLKIGPQNSSHAHYETDANTSHWFNKRVDVNGAIWRYNTNYGISSDGYFYAKGVYANRDGSFTLGGVSLYSNSDPMTYGIAFRGTGTYGTHGYVTAANDWATYLTMNDSGTTRGWIFRRGSTNVFSIAGSGDAYANGLINASRFISRVATGTQPYACTSTTVNTNLNADLLDGLHGSDFTRTLYAFISNGDNSMTSCTDFATWVSRLSSRYGILGTSSITTGAWWWVRSIDLQVNGWNIRTSGAMIIHAGDGNTSNKNYKHFLILDAYSDLYGITSNEESHKKYARFLNSNNYTSYVNPKATSKTIWGLTYIDASGNFLNVNGLLYVTANGNTTTIGSLNGSWCHIYNSANVPFIFNKSIHTIGSIYPHDNNTHQLGGSSNKWKHLFLSNRAYLDEWILFSGATGLYWPNTNGAHLYANTKTSYGGLITLGARNGYCGLHCGPDNTYMTVMSSVDHLGLYNESKGRWSFYYNRPNDRISIYNSSTDLGYGVQINQRTGIKINSYPSLHLVRTDAGETSMYFSNNTAGWAIGINPWSVGAGLFAIGLYSGTGGSYWRFRIDNNGYCFTRSYLNLGAGNEKNASNPPYVWGVNGSDNYLRTYATSSLSVGKAANADYATSSPAAVNYGGTGNTTKIKIKINSTTSWMLSFVVTIYLGYKSSKIMVSGYNYGSNYWYEPEAVLLGDSNGAVSLNVYFGYDSVNNLWVGFDGGSYTGVSITDVTNGYTQISSLKGLFTVSNVSSLSTILKTITAVNNVNNADKLDGYHEYSFLRYRDTTSTNGLGTLWSLIGIRSYHAALPDGLSGLYNYGQVVSFPGNGSRMDIFTNHSGSTDTVNLGLWWRSGWNTDKRAWRRIIDSGNIGSLFSAFSGGGISSSGNTITQANHSITVGGTTRTAGSSSCSIINSLSVSKATSGSGTNLTLGITINGVISSDKTITNLHATCLNNTSTANPASASCTLNKLGVQWFSQISSSSGYAGNNYGFPVSNNANGILYLGTHANSTANAYYAGQIGISSNGRLYYRFNNGSTWSTTANGGSWKTVAWTTDTMSYITVTNSDSNSTYRMVWHSGSSLYSTGGIYCNPYTDQIYSAGFRHVSYNSASYLLRSDGGAAAFNWSGQEGQPTWLWGGNSQHTYYVYNPSNFNVNSAAVLRGNASNPNNSHPGHGAKVFYSWNIGKVGNDTSGYSNGITIGSHPNDTAYGFQIVQNMWDDRTYTRRYNGGWQSWKTLAWTSDIPTVTNYYWANVKVSASSSTSTSPTFATATMTRGVVGGYNNTSYALSTSSFICQSWIRTTGSTGWYNESYGGGWNMTDTTYIRVYGSKRVYNDNTSQYAFYTAGGMTALGHMWSASSAQSWLNGQKAETAALNIAASSDTGSYWPWFRQTLTAASKWISVGTLGNSLYFIGSTTSRTANSYDYGFRMDFSNGYLYGNFSGSLSGNASSATNADKLDGYHASGLFTNLSNSGNNISVTIGGTNKTLTPAYASSAGTASKVTVTDSSTAYKILYANGTGSLSIYRLTATIGGAAKPIYISGGIPTACSSTVGNSRLPVYLSSGTITESPYSFYGSATQPIVLVAGRIYRSSNTAASNDWSFSGYKHESVGNLNSTPSISGGVARFTFNSVSGKTYYFIGAVVNHGTSSEVTSATSGDYSNVRSDGLYWFGTYVSDPYIYIRACCNADNNNDSTQSREGAWKNWSGAVLSFSIIIIGRATSS